MGVRALVATLALLAAVPGPARADFHVQGFGVAKAGTAAVTPALSDTPQRHTTSLQFDAVGGMYQVPHVTAQITWDCTTDETEDDLPLDQRHGFTLTSLDADKTIAFVHDRFVPEVDPAQNVGRDFETTAAGAGDVIGRCTGTTPDFPDEPIELTCPAGLAGVLTYARVASLIQVSGLCTYSWLGAVSSGDFTMDVSLAPAPGDAGAYQVVAATFRFRA